MSQESKFVINGTLGEGGMGNVYDAYDKNLRRKVAIKSIIPDRAHDSVLRRYFTKEAQITGQLEHPNIIPVHEMATNPNDELYYVMKRVDGETLADILEGIKAGERSYIKTYTLGSLLSIFQKVCDAIAYAHSRGVIHLDLKPENIMVGGYGEVLVLDWGIARLRRRSKNVSVENLVDLDEAANISAEDEDEKVLGSLSFMAPEQATGKSTLVGTRTDIYALGGILYNILTLRSPALGDSSTVIIKKIITGRVIHPLSYNEPNNRKKEDQVLLQHLPGEKVPEALAMISMKAMSEQLNDRYQTVAELQKDLFAYFAGHVTSVEDASLYRHFRLYLNRNRYVLYILALIVITNVILFLVFLLTIF